MKFRIIGLRHASIYLTLLALTVASCSSDGIVEKDCGDHILVYQKDGPTLGYSKTSNIRIIRLNGKAYKDLNGNGILDTYENWRMNQEKRMDDLISNLGVDVMLRLMLYTPAIDLNERTLKKDFKEAVKMHHIRHFLIGDIEDNVAAARWMNGIQSLCEIHSIGIPAVFGSYRRNNTAPADTFVEGKCSNISHWPEELGMAATFDPTLYREYGQIASQELRALGITSSVTHSADIATDPRWSKFNETLGESEKLVTEFIREYCDAMQTTPGSDDGWGSSSVNCMVGSWPGDGKEEGGRDAGMSYGKYSVYPGKNFDEGAIPFRDGALHLSGPTSCASAVMVSCPISFGQDPSGCNVGNCFSPYIVDTLLRRRMGYNGVISTDWNAVRNYVRVHHYSGCPWGVETRSETERLMMACEAGCDQICGLMDGSKFNKVLDAYIEKYGNEKTRQRFEATARRLLRDMFNLGLFENPYVEVDEVDRIVGNAEFCKAGYEAQLRSVVMIKNDGTIHSSEQNERRLKVWEPVRHCPEGTSVRQYKTKESHQIPIDPATLEPYFDIASTPSEADLAIVYIQSPFGHWGYIPNGTLKEGRYCPISLQYGDYTARLARRLSIGGGDPKEKSRNRSYFGVTEHTTNIGDMTLVQTTRLQMGDKPVVVVVDTDRPFVPSEIEPYANAILLTFGVSNQALAEILGGKTEPTALLPFQMPADMDTVETQSEDVSRDMKCYTDAVGNTYDFGFGLDWSGVIRDNRTKRY